MGIVRIRLLFTLLRYLGNFFLWYFLFSLVRWTLIYMRWGSLLFTFFLFVPIDLRNLLFHCLWRIILLFFSTLIRRFLFSFLWVSIFIYLFFQILTWLHNFTVSIWFFHFNILSILYLLFFFYITLNIPQSRYFRFLIFIDWFKIIRCYSLCDLFLWSSFEQLLTYKLQSLILLLLLFFHFQKKIYIFKLSPNNQA